MELNSNLNYFDMTGGEGHTLFIGLSWEERCFLGAKEVYQRFNRMSNVYMFYNIHSSTDDNLNKSKINRYFSERHVEVTTIELDYSNPFKCWTVLNKLTQENQSKLKKPIVDITTMPREITWMLFYFIKRFTSIISSIYHLSLIHI